MSRDTEKTREGVRKAGRVLRDQLAKGGRQLTQEQAENRVKQARNLMDRKRDR